jgi:excisionase family DNA binding protein
MAKEFLDIKELATCLNLKQSTLYSLVARGQIPHYRFGRLLRFKKAEIDYWLESHRIAQKDHMGLRMEDISQDPTVDVVNSIVEKAIEEVTGKRYTPNHGKPDRVKGLRKEVEHVTQ